MRTRFLFAIALLAAAAVGDVARADPYPVSGKWTYDNAEEEGPAKECGTHTMEFNGVMRLDTGSGAPEYKNMTVTKFDTARWRVVDQFFTGQIWGRVSYTMQLVDDDHLKLRFDIGGRVSALRRCAA
jgi:hypothetical protein